MPDDLSVGTMSFAHLRPKGPAAVALPPIECGNHFLYSELVKNEKGKAINGCARLDIPRWFNTTQSAITAGGLTTRKELYISTRTFGGGGFIWVPRTGRPNLSTLIDLIVGHTGGSMLYRNVSDSRSSAAAITAESQGEGSNTRTGIYELWAVPQTVHGKRIVTPGEGARSVHQLFAHLAQ